MKCRLYRGPADGKIYTAPDHETVISVSTYKADFLDALTNPMAPLNMHNHKYYRTNHTHPDGSVFFEWSRPRGTKIHK